MPERIAGESVKVAQGALLKKPGAATVAYLPVALSVALLDSPVTSFASDSTALMDSVDGITIVGGYPWRKDASRA